VFKKLLFIPIFLLTIIQLQAQQFGIFYPTAPHLQVRSNSGSVQLGIATCNGCFSSIAKTSDVVLRANGMATGDFIISARSNDGIIFSTGDGNTDSKKMEILNNGKVIIGNVNNTPNDYKLYVEKGILAERLKVAVKTSSDWADYVFAKDYNLLPLEEVQSFIQQKQHLPDIPSADEMVKNGMDVLEMNAKLLQKVEELTLYLIQMNEKIKTLEQQLNNN